MRTHGIGTVSVEREYSHLFHQVRALHDGRDVVVVDARLFGDHQLDVGQALLAHAPRNDAQHLGHFVGIDARALRRIAVGLIHRAEIFIVNARACSCIHRQ